MWRFVAFVWQKRFLRRYASDMLKAPLQTGYTIYFREDHLMNEPIYRFYRGRFTSAWHQLTQGEKDEAFAAMGKAFQETSGKSVVPACFTCWSSDWHVFGVEVYPSLEAIQQWRDIMERLGLFQYFELESMIGVQQVG